ncbi:MAG: DUF4233 domain-containing protein [Actinomycetota bacterium]
MTDSAEDPSLDSGEEPSLDEQVADRRVRANKATRGALAAVLCLEAFCLLLVPRAIAQTSVGVDATKTALLIGLAVVLVAVGFLLRRPWSIGVGSALQAPFFATGIWVPAFFVVGVVFIGIWLYLLNLRHDIVGTPGGLRMLVS